MVCERLPGTKLSVAQQAEAAWGDLAAKVSTDVGLPVFMVTLTGFDHFVVGKDMGGRFE